MSISQTYVSAFSASVVFLILAATAELCFLVPRKSRLYRVFRDWTRWGWLSALEVAASGLYSGSAIAVGGIGCLQLVIEAAHATEDTFVLGNTAISNMWIIASFGCCARMLAAMLVAFSSEDIFSTLLHVLDLSMLKSAVVVTCDMSTIAAAFLVGVFPGIVATSKYHTKCRAKRCAIFLAIQILGVVFTAAIYIGDNITEPAFIGGSSAWLFGWVLTCGLMSINKLSHGADKADIWAVTAFFAIGAVVSGGFMFWLITDKTPSRFRNK